MIRRCRPDAVPSGLFGEAIADRAFEFGIQRQHGAEDFAERGEIVVGDPAAEMQQLLVEDRRWVEDGENVLWS